MLRLGPSLICGSLAAIVAPLCLTSSTHACSHTWRINEVFSSADGTVQFIELHESQGSQIEWHLLNLAFLTDSSIYVFPSYLPEMTANHKFLMGTAAYAALPGAVQPDYVIPPNFFSINGDTLVYHVYDSLSFPVGALPTDGVLSLNRDFTTGVNSPTNFAGQTGSIDASPALGDLNGDHLVNGLDIGVLLANWSIPPGAPGCGGAKSCPSDLDHDGVVDGLDIGILLGEWTG